MPKSSYQHDRDGYAIDALRAMFPKFWLYKDPTNMFGRKEYSEDLIIEIVNDDEKRTVTGIEFGVQNKTDIEIRKRHISVLLAIDDIDRLLDLPRPILIHGYDITNDRSYWLWLNEWYETNHDKLIQAKRKQQKQLGLKIPKKNVLDTQSVQKICDYATWEHRKQKVKEKAGMVARQYGKDYAVDVIEDSFSITTIVDPRHEGAIPVVVTLDEFATDAMIRAIETGVPTPLVGNFAISNIPELAVDGIPHEVESAWLIPKTSIAPVPLKIEFLDCDRNIIFKTPHLVLQEIQPGTVISVWQGVDKKKHITYA